jgi:outer membrane protein assembly factor BamB
MRILSVLLLVMMLCASSFAKFDEWPKWLGPHGDGISTDPIADKWPQGGPPKVWDQKVGLGYSSPIGFDGKVYLFAQNGDLDTLTAFDADSGRPVWRQSYPCTIKADQGQAKNSANGLPLPLATPAIDNGRIYTYGGGGDLVCRKIEDGSVAWQLNVLKAINEEILGWNQASSPLVGDRLVYVQGGKGGPTAVAVDKETGKLAWTSEARSIGGYAAPIIVEVDGTKQLIIFGGDHLYGMNPETGKTIWGVPWKTAFDVNAATPIYHDHHLFISSDYGHGSMMLTLSGAGAKEVWDHDDKNIMLKYQTAVLDNGVLYANSMGVLKCMKWPEGTILWKGRDGDLREGGTMVRDGDKLITLSQDGNLSLIQATPQVHRVISQIHLFDFGTTWSTPLIYHGKVYAMGKDHLVCLDISNHAAAGPHIPEHFASLK